MIYGGGNLTIYFLLIVRLVRSFTEFHSRSNGLDAKYMWRHSRLPEIASPEDQSFKVNSVHGSRLRTSRFGMGLRRTDGRILSPSPCFGFKIWDVREVVWDVMCFWIDRLWWFSGKVIYLRWLIIFQLRMKLTNLLVLYFQWIGKPTLPLRVLHLFLNNGSYLSTKTMLVE